MKVYRSSKALTASRKPLFLTIGTFDGVHRGHLKVLEGLKKRACSKAGRSCVLTFRSHPGELLHPDRRPHLLTSTLHKLVLMDRAGIDDCLLLDFTKGFSQQTPEAFVKDFLVKKLRVQEVHLGYKSRFGTHRAGDTALMARLSRKYGFSFKETAPFKDGGIPLSSTLIRELIQRGDLKEASRFLGRPYSLIGVTVKGRGLGKRLGYPTANLDIRSEIVPPRGVYAVTVNILKCKDRTPQDGSVLESRSEAAGLRGVLNLGYRPTVQTVPGTLGTGSKTCPQGTRYQTRELVPEVHLLDYHKELYGRVLEVTFHTRIRDEVKFRSLAELKIQIGKDLETAKKILR